MAVLQQVRRSVRVGAPAAVVWTALGEPSGLARWLGVQVDEVVPGALGRTTTGAADDRRVRIDVVEPPDHLGLSWWSVDDPSDLAVVDVHVDADGDATRVRVVETAAVDADPDRVAAAVGAVEAS